MNPHLEKLAKDISVIVPAYNALSYIQETLISILEQTYKPGRIIVVDDGSSDGTADLVKKNKNLAGVECISQKNRGQGLARAAGIAAADTSYIALCDSDDLWNHDHLERKIAALLRYPESEFLFSCFYAFGPGSHEGYSILDESPEYWRERFCTLDDFGTFKIQSPYLAVLKFNPAYPSGMMFRRDSYKRMGGFKERYSRWIAEDSEFTRRFASLEGCVFVGDTQATWGYRRHESNYSAIQWKNIKAKADILDEHLNLGIVPTGDIETTRKERDFTRGVAFDQACWEKATDAVASLFAELPPGQRTAKRRAKAVLAKAGLFL